MAGATTAFFAVGFNYAVLLNPHCVTDLYRRFFGRSDFLYGTSRADLGTTGTFGTAETVFKLHFGLHECFQIV